MGWLDWIPSRQPLRRISVDIDRRWNITSYGSNNLYPQEMHQIKLRSPLVSRTIKTLSEFIAGDGFTSNITNPVNLDGHTINDVLKMAVDDLSEYNSFALMLDLNGLGQAQSVSNIPVEFVRFGLPDNLGRHTDVKISNNWEQYSSELPQGSEIDEFQFPLWNPLTNQENGLKGQSVVLYYTEKPHSYSLVTFDTVTNAAQADADIQQFELNAISNNFNGLTLFKTTFESDDEKAALYDKLSQVQGVGGNGILVVEVDDDAPPLLENLPPNNVDTLYLNTIIHLRETILQAYGISGVLLGVTNTGAVFNEQALLDSFVVMNTKTKGQRNIVERIFNSFGTFGEIIPQQILTQEAKEEVVQEVTEEEEPEEEEETTETEETDAA